MRHQRPHAVIRKICTNVAKHDKNSTNRWQIGSDCKYVVALFAYRKLRKMEKIKRNEKKSK